MTGDEEWVNRENMKMSLVQIYDMLVWQVSSSTKILFITFNETEHTCDTINIVLEESYASAIASLFRQVAMQVKQIQTA